MVLHGWRGQQTDWTKFSIDTWKDKDDTECGICGRNQAFKIGFSTFSTAETKIGDCTSDKRNTLPAKPIWGTHNELCSFSAHICREEKRQLWLTTKLVQLLFATRKRANCLPLITSHTEQSAKKYRLRKMRNGLIDFFGNYGKPPFRDSGNKGGVTQWRGILEFDVVSGEENHPPSALTWPTEVNVLYWARAQMKVEIKEWVEKAVCGRHPLLRKRAGVILVSEEV